MIAGSFLIRPARTRDALCLLATSLALAGLLGACGSSGRHAVPTLPTTVTTQPSPSTTVPSIQTSGPRTVLSPIGLNVRAQPSRSARVLGTAAQGAALEVVGHTSQGGGWYEVKGATVTGWITASRVLSATGTFAAYSSAPFGALYPTGWTYRTSSPGAITFRAGSGDESIVVTTAASIGQLGLGRPGYYQYRSETAVACGVTSYLRTYAAATAPATTGPATVGSPSYLAQLRLPLAAHHALGIFASFVDLSDLQTVRDFINSVTFPFPQCQR